MMHGLANFKCRRMFGVTREANKEDGVSFITSNFKFMIFTCIFRIIELRVMT
jgi:hypothetical protein